MTASGTLRRLARTWGTAALACAAGALIVASIARGQAGGGERITPNFKDADIGQIADAVAMATHKNFIIDPRVRANVNLIATTPMSADAFYQTFLAILQVHGFIAVQA